MLTPDGVLILDAICMRLQIIGELLKKIQKINPILLRTSVDHSAILTGLSPLTTYQFRVGSQDIAGNLRTVGSHDIRKRYAFQNNQNHRGESAMQFTTLLGSAKKKGNTAMVLGWVEEELISSGHAVERIYLNSQSIEGCLECAKCGRHVCSLRSDGGLFFSGKTRRTLRGRVRCCC